MFLEVAKARRPQRYVLLLVLFTTMMRPSTALALRWENLDLETKDAKRTVWSAHRFGIPSEVGQKSPRQ